MAEGAKAVNLGVRFLLELATLAALAVWGFRAGDGFAVKLALGLGAPLLAALTWGAFVAPKSKRRLAMPWRLVPELAVFGAGILALAAAGRVGLAAMLAFIVLVNELLITLWRQRAN